MGIKDSLKNTELPATGQLIKGYQDIKTSVQRVTVNTINVRFFPKNSFKFKRTKGMLYHFGVCSLLKIEVPEKLGWVIQDDSIYWDDETKEEWVDCRQDYPLTMSVNKEIGSLLKRAVQQFPDVLEWYIPASINRIPIKNIIIRHDLIGKKEEKETLEKSGISKNIIEWLDKIPAEFTVIPAFLYTIGDIEAIQSMKNEDGKFNWVAALMGAFPAFILGMMFMGYIG